VLDKLRFENRDSVIRYSVEDLSTTPTTWVFLTNHANVLLCVARDPDARARDIAERVGITERAAQRILSELLADGYISKIKLGRRNRYTVNREGQLRHPNFQELEIGPLIDMLQRGPSMTPVEVEHHGV
jgi:DNA-binding MarR family transcriptional regulator